MIDTVLAVPVPARELAEFCRKWQITQVSLFGSALRDDFGPSSDIDLLVAYAPDSRHSLFDLDAMEAELKGIFGREVDLVSKQAVEQSENYIRRKEILRTAHVIYDSRSGISAGYAPCSEPRGGVHPGA
jgi:uncharacterized protein